MALLGSGAALQIAWLAWLPNVASSLAPVAFVPATRSSTKKVRGLLPESVPHADAAANAARAALLAHALCTDTDLLLDATEDWLHQSYRASAMPRTAELVAQLRADGIAAVVSGAGPTVLALTTISSRQALLDQAQCEPDLVQGEFAAVDGKQDFHGV